MDEIRYLQEVMCYNSGSYDLQSDLVAREISLVIYINGKRLLSLACLPENLVALAYGFIFSEGLVQSKGEIRSYEFNQDFKAVNFILDIPENRINNFLTTGEKTSGCGSSLTSSLNGRQESFKPVDFEAKAVLQLMNQFLKNSTLFRQTGGVHGACLVQKKEIQFRADDIGRHNAVDKVAGIALLENKSLCDYILLCSGRISSEIVKKSFRLGIPMIVSHSAPTSKAIKLGWQYKVYLLGFARASRFNIYTGFEEDTFAI